MIDVDVTDAAAGPAATECRRRIPRRWFVLSAVLLLIIAGTVLVVSVSHRYLHAAALSTNGGGWLPPDNAHVRSVSAGQYMASVVPPRPGHWQTFQLDLDNFSGVSQTVLGLTHGRELSNPRLTGEPESLTVSTSAIYPSGNEPPRFTSRPVTIPPGGQYALRFSVLTSLKVWSCKQQRSEYENSLSLQVRVGRFTRTENVDFGDQIMEIRTTGHC